MPHRETSLDIQQAIYQSKSKGDDPPKYKERVSKVYSYAVNSTVINIEIVIIPTMLSISHN